MTLDLEQVYKDSFYPSANKLYKIAKKLELNVTMKDVQNFVANQSTSQIFRKKVNKKGYIVAFAPQERVQMDIVVMDKFGQTNSGYKYILLLIDVFTRKGYGIPMKTKNISDTSKALKHFCDKYFTPKILNCDNDSSFLGNAFNKVVQDYGITLDENDVGDHNALGVIDRFIQTIKNNIYKYFKAQNTTKWLSTLDNVIDSYNNTPHPSIGNITPNEATQHINAIFSINIDKLKINSNKFILNDFTVGQFVRIAIHKSKLNKRSYTQKYSDDVYEIQRVTDKYLLLKDYDKRVLKSNVIIVQNPVHVSTPNLDDAIQTDTNNRALRREGIEDYNRAPYSNEVTYWANPFV